MINSIKKLLSENIILKQFSKYFIIGVLNNGLYYGSFLIFIYVIDLHYFIGVTISYIFSVCFSYMMNSKWTFGMDPVHLKRTLLFLLVYTVGYFTNILLLYTLVDKVGLFKWLSQFIATPFVVAINFLGLKYFVFRGNRKYALS